MRIGVFHICLILPFACTRSSGDSGAAAMSSKPEAGVQREAVSKDAPPLVSVLVPRLADAAVLDASGDVPSDKTGASPTEGVNLLSSEIVSAKSIGHTSVVFKLTLANGDVAAFKPPSKRGKNRYRGEVAAYRLAGLLALENVPPAKLVQLPRASLRSVLDEAGKKLLDEETAGDSLVGAWIPWIRGLEFLHIDETDSKERERVFRFLRSGDGVDSEIEPLALQVSTMMVFDFLTANWDRFSGANIGWDSKAKRVLFIDNDGGFFEPVNAKLLARDRRELEKIRVFSKAFVSKLRDVGENDWARTLSQGDQLLTPGQIRAAWERRTLVLDHIARVEVKSPVSPSTPR